jgi:hypothetical protein
MSDETLKLLQQLRADIITTFTRVEIQITALEYAVLDKKLPLDPNRLEQLQKSVEADSALMKEIRGYLDRAIRNIS